VSLAAEMRRCLEALDIAGIRRLWRHAAPGMPQPESDDDALIAIHIARTASETIDFKLRAYSHSWLAERDIPSQLPDSLRPRAERLYPRVAEAVGIAALIQRPYTPVVQGVMRDAVAECYADGERCPKVIRGLMMERRAREMKRLLG